MRLHFIPVLSLITIVGTACSSLEAYRVPETGADIATIEDEPYKFGDFEYLEVMSIDRSRIDGQSRGVPAAWSTENGQLLGDPEALIPLQIGIRKLEARACKYSPPLQDGLMFGGWHCGHAVLRLVVESGTHYRVRGLVNKKEDYAELWIENTESGQTVTNVTRVAIEG